MNTEKLELNFEILIDAPIEHVYKSMLNKENYEEWTTPFSVGSTYDGDWSEGSTIKFIDSKSGDGMYSEIAENRENEFVSIRHLGIIKDGVIDTESDEVKSWTPSFENYTFSEVDGQTLVHVYMDTNPEYSGMFEDMWPKSLQILKEICER